MPQPEHVRLLLAKAAQDEYVLAKFLKDPNAPIEIFGFHAQQAAEKLLKAVLSHAAIDHPLSHRLAELMDMARDRGIAIPDEFEELRLLTPFAVEFRYDIFPSEPEDDMDKKKVWSQLQQFRRWVEKFISGS